MRPCFISLHALVVALLTEFAFAHPHPHTEETGARLPSTWYHHEKHEVHDLFRRDAASTDGTTYATVGTPQWQAGWTWDRPTKDKLPAAWFNALDAAVAAGKIPNIAPPVRPTLADGTLGNPVYANGADPAGAEICSQTAKCLGKGVIKDAPDGVFGSSFDDGPAAGTSELVDFLQANNASTTHFMIGQYILKSPDLFLKAFNAGQDIAVHTWSHPMMTTLTNEEIIAELGCTMEIIRNSTGGRVPKYWRAPYGDADNRVNAIASEVFHLTNIWWNQDTVDWSINSTEQPTTTLEAVETLLDGWVNGPKSPGLIILEHELKAETIAAFKHIFPIVKQTGWTFASVSQLFNDKTPYQNAGTSANSTVKSQAIVGAVAAASASGSGSGAKTGGTATATGTIAGTAGKDSESSSAIRFRSENWLLSCIIACLVLYINVL